MPVIDIEADARRVLEIIRAGGTAIIPADTGYGLIAATPEAVARINATKRRGGHKRNTLMHDVAGQPSLHKFGARAQEMVDAIALDYALPIGVLGPINPENEIVAGMSAELLGTTTAHGNISALVNSGRFLETLTGLARKEGLPVIGSSANLTGSGTKFSVDDIEPEVRSFADIEIDYGRTRYHLYGRSASIIDFETLEVFRFGACYDLIAELLARHFRVELPEDPGVSSLPSGHVDEFRLARQDK